MDSFISFLREAFSFLGNRSILKKYLHSETDLTEAEAKLILSFLREYSVADNEGDDKYLSLIDKQTNLKTIPYLKELSIEELDFLTRKGIDLDGILYTIHAKGGLTKGMGDQLIGIHQKKDIRRVQQF